MKIDYGFDTFANRIKVSALTLWMEYEPGEGELEIEDQGRYRISNVFSQETEAIGQHTPRIGVDRPKLMREFSAGRTNDSDSTPHLSFSIFGSA